MAFQLLQRISSGHVNVKKGTGHVFYMATPSHATESVCFFLLRKKKQTVQINGQPLNVVLFLDSSDSSLDHFISWTV